MIIDSQPHSNDATVNRYGLATSQTYTRTDVQRLEREWWAAQDAPKSFDEMVSEPFYSNITNAKTAFDIAFAVYHNMPALMPCAEDIERLETSRKPAAAPTPQTERRLIMGRDGYPLGILDVDVPAPVAEPVPAETRYTGRMTGTIRTWNRSGKWGYIAIDREADVRISDPSYVLGLYGKQSLLRKGAKVEFTRSMANTALDVVMIGVQSSRDAYEAKSAREALNTRLVRTTRPARYDTQGTAYKATPQAELDKAAAVLDALRNGKGA